MTQLEDSPVMAEKPEEICSVNGMESRKSMEELGEGNLSADQSSTHENERKLPSAEKVIDQEEYQDAPSIISKKVQKEEKKKKKNSSDGDEEKRKDKSAVKQKKKSDSDDGIKVGKKGDSDEAIEAGKEEKRIDAADVEEKKCKKEKKENKEKEEKKEKKERREKNGQADIEKLQKKLEKIDGKLKKILEKKEDYIRRIKCIEEKERGEILEENQKVDELVPPFQFVIHSREVADESTESKVQDIDVEEKQFANTNEGHEVRNTGLVGKTENHNPGKLYPDVESSIVSITLDYIQRSSYETI